jgi:hypothetical protein
MPNFTASSNSSTMAGPVVDYYRCPEWFADFSQLGPLSEESGFFRFGDDICYGRCVGGTPAPTPTGDLYDCASKIELRDGLAHLPFDQLQLLDNLRLERYASGYADSSNLALFNALVRRAYYLIRPALHVSVRKHIQKLHFRTWNDVGFPHWPVDCTVDRIMEKLLRLALQANRAEAVPFIWFWPEGMPSAAIMTHDVETRSGRDFCDTLMDIDESFGLASSFQVVPETRYSVPADFLTNIHSRGFEVNVHDLNHDGHLFQNEPEFLRRAAKINQYLKEYGAQGFRAAIMYRNQDWYDALEASYDMSVPNAAHLDPQRGGCCTVMPYFIGKLLELPVTATQDYGLFNILGRYSTDLWNRQIELVMEKHGLISFIVHPDYVIEERARATYTDLLQHLSDLRSDKKVWFALPRDVNHWWRQRSQMQLIRTGRGWTIEGPGKERACVAYAHADGDRLRYSVGRLGSDRFLSAGAVLKRRAAAAGNISTS